MGYPEIVQAAKDLREERHQAFEAAKAKAAALDEELTELDSVIVEIEGVAKDFGGGTPAPSPEVPPAPPKKPPAGNRSSAAAPGAPPGGRASGKSAGPSKAQKAADVRSANVEKVLSFLKRAEADDGWVAPPRILGATELGRRPYQIAVKDLVDAGKVESKGSRGSLRYRARERSTSSSKAGPTPDDDSSPAPEPEPLAAELDRAVPEPEAELEEPPEPERSHLERKALEMVEAHPNETATAIAQRMGRGSKAGIMEVTAAIEELAAEDALRSNDGDPALWRTPEQGNPGAPFAPVETGVAAGGGASSPKTRAEQAIVAAVAHASKDIGEIAEATELPDATVGAIVPALCSRGVLQRGQRGTIPVFGKAVKR